MENYIFCSERLGFRAWKEEDLDTMHSINQCDAVMEYFPFKPTHEQTHSFINRMIDQYKKYAYCYFATEILSTGELIGFIGFSYQNYPAPFTPCTDIGWRLAQSHWGKGYATEGAIACLDYATNILRLNKVYSVCSAINTKSEHVMKKIGMVKAGNFVHPKLRGYDDLKDCIWYEKKLISSE